jgi:hypothetical protein
LLLACDLSGLIQERFCPWKSSRSIQKLDPIENSWDCASAVAAAAGCILLKTITLDPFRFLIISLAGWINEQQQYANDYLREENRELRARLGNRRLRLTDDQRRSLAGKAVLLGRKLLADVATIVTPATLLNWHRRLIARKYDGRLQPVPAGPGLRSRSKSWLYEWRRKTAIEVTCGYKVHSRISVIRWRTAASRISSSATGLSPLLTESGRRPEEVSYTTLGAARGG